MTSSNFVSPRLLPYLSESSEAHDLIDSLRWNSVAPVCPRCRSNYTRQINTNIFRQLYRCIDCGYMFNSLAGTIFQGSKMPVNKHFHFFILHNALKSELPPRDICFALDVSHKTASLLMKKVQNISYPFDFAKVDKQAGYLSRRDWDINNGVSAPFFSYAEIKSVFVDDALFKNFLTLLTQGRMPGVALSATEN